MCHCWVAGFCLPLPHPVLGGWFAGLAPLGVSMSDSHVLLLPALPDWSPNPGPTCCRCDKDFMTASPAALSLLLTLSQLLPCTAPWGGWGSPLPGRGRGRKKEVHLNTPLSLSAPFLPVPLQPLSSHLAPGAVS